MSEDLAKRKMLLDMEIIDLFHILRTDSNNSAVKKLIVEALIRQREIDFKNFKINLNRNENIKQMYETQMQLLNGPEIFEKLNVSEKRFLKDANYDIKKDEYNLFNSRPTVINSFTKKYKEIQRKKIVKTYMIFTKIEIGVNNV